MSHDKYPAAYNPFKSLKTTHILKYYNDQITQQHSL